MQYNTTREGEEATGGLFHVDHHGCPWSCPNYLADTEPRRPMLSLDAWGALRFGYKLCHCLCPSPRHELSQGCTPPSSFIFYPAKDFCPLVRYFPATWLDTFCNMASWVYDLVWLKAYYDWHWPVRSCSWASSHCNMPYSMFAMVIARVALWE